MAEEKLPPGFVDVPTSAAGPSAKLRNDKDGTVHVEPGKAHEAKEGKVINSGVRTVAVGGSGSVCPGCSRSGTLKIRRNRPVGKRIFCSACGYDQGKENNGVGGVTTVSARDTKIVSGGVKIVRQRGPKG
jgi:Zn ribbon nucleic-acid-binding protein